MQPKVRFKAYKDNWKTHKISKILEKVKEPVKVDQNVIYREIGIRSHGRGVFYKEPVAGKELGNKSVFWVVPNVFVVNIVFAWERAVARTTKNELGMIASHRFPMFKPKENMLDLDFVTLFFITPKGKYLLELASPGGAGRNKTLGQKEFENLQINIPSLEEQKKIAMFITLLNKKIGRHQEKMEQHELFKKGILQKIFSQEIRFKDDNGQDFPDWEERLIGDLGCFSKGGSISKSDLSESGEPCILYGELYTRYHSIIIEVYSKTEVNKNVVYGKINDVLIPSSGEKATDIAKASALLVDKVVLGGDLNVFRPNDDISGPFLSYQINATKRLELAKLAQGASVVHLYAESIKRLRVWRPDIKEQAKIVSFLSLLDKKIAKEREAISLLNALKSGFLRKMFV